MSRVIGILSGKGGVGKTTFVANLGAALTNEFNKNIIILDTNVNSSHLGMHLGIYQDLPITLREVAKANIPLTNATYIHPATGIRILPAPLNGRTFNLTPTKLREITGRLAQDYNLVIMDCSPGLGKEVVTSVSALDSAIVVTTPDFPAVTDALKTVDFLKNMDKEVLGIVINRIRGEKYELTIPEVESTCGVPVIGIIPEDKRVPEGIATGLPSVLLSPHSPSSVAFKYLAGRLVGESYRPAGILQRIKEIFSRSRFQSRQKIDAQEFTESVTKNESYPEFSEERSNIENSEKENYVENPEEETFQRRNEEEFEENSEEESETQKAEVVA